MMRLAQFAMAVITVTCLALFMGSGIGTAEAAGCTPIDFGAEPLTGSIEAAAQVDCYEFSAAAGDQIRVRLVETSGSLYAVKVLLRPEAPPCSDYYYNDMTCLASTAGVYKIHVYDYYGDRTGTYAIELQRLNSPAGCTPLAFGTPPHIASAGNPAESDCYTFSAQAGDRIRVRMVETSGSLYAVKDLFRPDGTRVCSDYYYNDMTCLADVAGSFTVLAYDYYGDRIGNYAIELQRLNAPGGCSPIAFGAPPLTGSIGDAGEMRCYTFSATAGDLIRVRVVETSGSLYAVKEMAAPDGSPVCSDYYYNDMSCKAPTTGTYTVLVYDYYGDRTGAYSIYVQRLNKPLGCAALAFGGAPLARAIVAPAEADCYTFAATAGDHLRVRLVETSGSLYAVKELVRPDGSSSCSDYYYNDMPCVANVTGTYAIMIYDYYGDRAGNYSIELQRVNKPGGCTAIAFGAAPLAKSLVAAAEVDSYCFSATKDDQLRIRVVETSGSLYLVKELFGPDGNSVCSDYYYNDMSCKAPATGTYTVLVYDYYGDRTGAYSIYAQRLNKPAGCTSIPPNGTPLAGSFGAAAEVDCYTFSGIVNGHVRLTAVETSGSLYLVKELVRPNGTTLCSDYYYNDMTCVLDTAGPHTLLLYDYYGSRTGAYSTSLQAW